MANCVPSKILSVGFDPIKLCNLVWESDFLEGLLFGSCFGFWFVREEWIKAIQSVSQKLQVLEGIELKEEDLEEKRKKKKVVSYFFIDK